MADPTAAPTTGGLDPGSLAAQIISFIQSQNGHDTNQANDVANVADPFRGQRQGYMDQLHGLLSDPSSFQIDPGTQYSINAGNDAITRAANAQGVSRGGSVISDIGKNVTGQSEADYNTRIQQLLTASGATTGSPAAAALAVQQGQANTNGGLAAGLSALSPIAQQIIAALSKGGLGSGTGGTAPGDPGEPGGGTGGNGEPGGPNGPLMTVGPNPGDPGYVPPPIDPISSPPSFIQDPPPFDPPDPDPWGGDDSPTAGGQTPTSGGGPTDLDWDNIFGPGR